jgi:hypothetical protein
MTRQHRIYLVAAIVGYGFIVAAAFLFGGCL